MKDLWYQFSSIAREDAYLDYGPIDRWSAEWIMLRKLMAWGHRDCSRYRIRFVEKGSEE